MIERLLIDPLYQTSVQDKVNECVDAINRLNELTKLSLGGTTCQDERFPSTPEGDAAFVEANMKRGEDARRQIDRGQRENALTWPESKDDPPRQKWPPEDSRSPKGIERDIKRREKP